MKDSQIRLRIDLSTKEKLKKKAKERGLSLSEYLIRCGLHREMPKQLGEKEIEGVELLKNNQINYIRISNFIKSRNMLELSIELQQLIKNSKEAISKIINK